jgi:hypothetical protein
MSSNLESSRSHAAIDDTAVPASGPTDTAGAVVTHLVIADLAAHDKAIDGVVDGPDAEGAVIHRIDAAIDALGDVDFATWSDSSLSGHLDELSLVLCRIDAELSRLADAVRSRGFDIAEIDLPLAS